MPTMADIFATLSTDVAAAFKRAADAAAALNPPVPTPTPVPPPPPVPVPPTPTPGPPSNPTWTTAQIRRRKFNSQSPWNVAIPAGKTYIAPSKALPAASAGVNYLDYAAAVYINSGGDSLVSFDCDAGNNWRPHAVLSIKCPAGATPSGSGDASMTLIDTTVTPPIVYEFYAVSGSTGAGFVCGDYGSSSIEGSGIANKYYNPKTAPWANGHWPTWPDGNPGNRVSSVGWGTGAWSDQHYTDGAIPHALAIACGRMYMVNRDTSPNFGLATELYGGFPMAVWSDANVGGGNIRMGERLAIPPGVSAPGGLTVAGGYLFTCLQTYGAFVVDTTGTSIYNVINCDRESTTQAKVDMLRADFPKLLPLLKICV